MTGPALVPFATLELLPAGLRPDGQSYFGGALTAVRGVVFHVNAGNGDPYNWWTNPSNPHVASAHLQIMKTGQLKQYVRLDRVAWAEVAGNGEWHSVETEGFPTEPLTAAQFDTFARLLAWGHASAWAWPLQVCDDPAGRGLGTHQMGGAAWGGHACPGPIRAGQRPALLARAQQLLTPPPVQEDDDMKLISYQAKDPSGQPVGAVYVGGPGIWKGIPTSTDYKALIRGGSVTSPPTLLAPVDLDVQRRYWTA
jgi:hypothetical protein